MTRYRIIESTEFDENRPHKLLWSIFYVQKLKTFLFLKWWAFCYDYIEGTDIYARKSFSHRIDAEKWIEFGCPVSEPLKRPRPKLRSKINIVKEIEV